MPPTLRKPPVALLALLLSMLFAVSPARSAVFLSELCDPQNNFTTDRFIEIYNPGPSAADLTGWMVVAIANGADTTHWVLSGTLAAGQAKVCGNTTTVTGFTVHFPNATWGAGGYFNWNGKVGDGAKLVDNNGVIVQLPSIPLGGSPSVNGSLILGIGTQSNNQPSGVTTFPANQSAEFTTTFNGTSYRSSFIDSGSNGLFFPSTSLEIILLALLMGMANPIP